MQCLYWLVKAEVPHTTQYSSLLKAVQFEAFTSRDNAEYTSQRIVQEFFNVLVRKNSCKT